MASGLGTPAIYQLIQPYLPLWLIFVIERLVTASTTSPCHRCREKKREGQKKCFVVRPVVTLALDKRSSPRYNRNVKYVTEMNKEK